MANYKETTVLGSKWQRADKVIIDNPLGGIPTLYFSEEEIINLGDSSFKQQVGTISAQFVPSGVINLLNPETGEELGMTMTHLEVYIALHSLYMQLVKERDTIIIPEPEPLGPPIELPPPPAPPADPVIPPVEPPLEP